jgi:photosystem II stability/assembly factor-like uncharacterized protein
MNCLYLKHNSPSASNPFLNSKITLSPFRCFFLVFLFMGMSINIQAQQRPTNITPLAPPHITAATPDWAKLMYSDAPNVHEVDRLFNEYFRTRAYEKTVDTRNYKHWRRYLSRYDMVQQDGSIFVPTDEEREAEVQQWLAQKAQMDRQVAERGGGPTSNWEQIGPFENTDLGSSFTIRQSCQVAFSQCLGNLDVLYSVSQNGKIFKTTNHGDSWTAVGENYFFEGDTWTEQCITVHPTDPNTVYYGSGTKIWKTTDGGTTWATIFTLSGLEPNCILVHPINADTVFISSEKGIYRSTNAGVTFSQAKAGVSWDLRFKTNNPTTIFAICRNGTKSDFYKSTDGGATWPASINGWFANPQDSDGGGRMTVSTSNPNLIYCFIIGRVTGDPVPDKPIVGIAKSIDAGATWTTPITWNATQGINAGQGYYDLDIEVSDADDNLVYLGTQSDWSTSNGFANVISSTTKVHADVQEIHFNGPNDMWVASDGGMDLLDASIANSTPKSKGVTGTEFWGFDQGWNEDTRVGSYYHNGGSGYRQGYPNNQFRSVGGGEPATGYISIGNAGKTWFNEIGGKNFPTTLLGTVSNFTYGKFPNESYWGQDERGEIVPHPLYFNTHFLGKGNVLWKTTDGGTSFTAHFTFGADPLSLVTSIEISRSDPQFMLVYQLINNNGSYSSGKLWKTTNGGATFTEIVQPAGAPTSDGCFIALSPSNITDFWIAYNKTSSNKKVFKTTDGGTDWVNITGAALNGLVPRALLHIGGTNGGVYIMTRHTVFYRNNTDTEWQSFGNALPVKMENNYLRPFYKEGKIRMATVARGLWSVDFYENPSGPIAQPTVDKATTNCARDTFYFEDYSMLNHTNASWQWAFSPTPQWVSSTSARNPKVIFGASGNYQVTLTVTDGTGATSTKVVANMVTIGENYCGLESTTKQTLVVNGTTNYAACNTAIALGTTNTITISTWIKPSGTQVSNSGIIFSSNGGATGLNFRTGNQLGYHWADNSGSYNWTGGPTIASDVWTHVAMVIKPDSAIFYVNGVRYFRAAAHAAVNFTSPFNFGNDRGNSGRTMTGEIDEVRFYNRALTQAEVRDLRHLTYPSYAATDPNLQAYYKFDEPNGLIYDRVGGAHASLIGTASRVNQTGPFERGVSQRITATTDGVKDFAQANLALTFLNSGTFPNGELVVSRLDGSPVALLANYEAVGNKYWVINNHGTNQTFSSLTGMTFSGINVNSTVANRYKLYKRASNGHVISDWVFVDDADAVVTGTNGTITFNTNLTVTGFSQFVILQKGVRVAAKVFLEGNYNSTTGLMNDQLRSSSLIPTLEPYTGLSFIPVEGGGESTSSSVFASNGNNSIVDWVFVELRDVSNPGTRLFTRSALLQADGDIVDWDGVSPVHFANASNGNYFIAIKHRNHLGIRTPTALALTETPTVHDFTTGLVKAWDDPTNTSNDAMANLGSAFGLFKGNASGSDQLLNASDLLETKIGITPNQFNIYQKTDLNMDGLLNAFDLLQCKIGITPNKAGHL